MGRRNLSRVSSHRPPQPLNDDLYKYKCGSQGKLTAPKHIRLPKIVEDSALMFEIVMFVFTYAATFFQFLNLYRSVWWLPHSHTSYTMVRTLNYVLNFRKVYRFS
nr:PREDICTED: transmembrane protein 39A-A-like [Bemisia tabaci]